MANTFGNAYGLTVLSPIKNDFVGGVSCVDLTRKAIRDMALNENSPMAKVPNTYLARFVILMDVFYEDHPAVEEHLKSRYLIFSSNLYGDLDTYLHGMWKSITDDVRRIWKYCVAFDQVKDPADFAAYIKKCQINNALFANLSTDDPLDEQLKALYVKQQFSQFAADHQGLPGAQVQAAFKDFVAHVQPANLAGPSWRPGQSEL